MYNSIFTNKISIAPMLDWSDRHYRYFMRKLTVKVLLYTEMVVADAIIHGHKDKLLQFTSEESPIIVQLGGSDPEKLAIASKICQDYGYDGINLNVGCPSDRVKSGNFGACLMNDPILVAKCIDKMQQSCSLPISIKHRIGLGYENNFDFLLNFINIISSAGCKDFIIHARNAILTGLSPKQNREIPILKYDYVYQIKQLFPQLNIVINGGIKTKDDIKQHLTDVDGVMIGREAYYNPYLFNDFDLEFYHHNHPIKTRYEVAYSMIEYLEQQATLNIPLHYITRHMVGLYHGKPNAKQWRFGVTQGMQRDSSIQSYLELLSNIRYS
jgi:tRNA-dihydrouridine synthase A